MRTQQKFVNAETLIEIEKSMRIECQRLKCGLPIYADKHDVAKTGINTSNQVSVIIGEPGSGKSTQMVQYLYESEIGENGKTVCTQPRILAVHPE